MLGEERRLADVRGVIPVLVELVVVVVDGVVHGRVRPQSHPVPQGVLCKLT